jgi:hypothetical protein
MKTTDTCQTLDDSILITEARLEAMGAEKDKSCANLTYVFSVPDRKDSSKRWKFTLTRLPGNGDPNDGPYWFMDHFMRPGAHLVRTMQDLLVAAFKMGAKSGRNDVRTRLAQLLETE